MWIDLGGEQRRARPLRFAARRIPIIPHHQSADFADALARRQELLDVGQVPEGARLMTYLNDVLAAILHIGRAHALGLIERVRQRLFLIYVLAGIQSGHKLPGMQVRRRGDDHGVDGWSRRATAG